MRLAVPIVYLLLSCCLWKVESLNGTSIIEVTNGGKKGEWGEWKICPKGIAKGFSLKIQPKQRIFSDNTSLNGIRLVCSDDSIITSAKGKDGTWSDAYLCKSSFLTSFSLRVAISRLLRDNTGANNIKFMCTDGTELEGNGHAWGEYGSWSESCEERGICGIQTKVHFPRRFVTIDSTGLNDVKFFCCL